MGSPFRNLFDTLTDGLRNAASPDFVEHQLLAIQIQSKAGFLGESWRGPLVGLRAWRMGANEVRLQFYSPSHVELKKCLSLDLAIQLTCTRSYHRHTFRCILCDPCEKS